MTRPPRTGLVRLVAALVGPERIEERTRFCRDFDHTIHCRFGLDAEEETTLRSMDKSRLLSLVESEVGQWLTWFWKDAAHAESHVTAYDVPAERSAERNDLAITVVGHLMEDDRATGTSVRRAAFLTGRERLASAYPLNDDAHAHVVQMSPSTIASDAAFIRDEVRTAFDIEKVRYGSAREGLRGPWIESVSTDVCRATCRMRIRIEGAGFVACPEIYVGLVSTRLIDPDPGLVSYWCSELKTAQSLTKDWISEPAALAATVPSPCATPHAIPSEVTIVVPGEHTCAVDTVDEQTVRDWLDAQGVGRRVVLSSKASYEPTLTALSLGESRKSTPSAAAFVLHAEVDISGICPGEYDLWIAQGTQDGRERVVILTAPAPTPVYVPQCSSPSPKPTA